MPPGNFDAIIYGHTHLWELSNFKFQSKIICNTGSITFPKGGKVPTFGMMDNGVITIRDLQDNILAEEEI